MNIELQCIALFVMVVLFIMFFREKKLNLTNRVLFIKAIAVCFVCLIFDILSIISIYHSTYSDFSPGISKLLCKLYIMLLVTQGYFGYNYAATSLLPRKDVFEVIKYCYHGIFITGEVLMFALPIEYHMDGRVVYSSGASTNVAYCLAGIFILSTLVISIYYRKQMPKRRFTAMLIWEGTWLLAALLQNLIPELLLISFASAFGMVILYIQLESPSEYIDNATGLFTMNALSMFVHDRYRYNKKFSMFTAKINYIVSSVDYDMEQNVVMRTARTISQLGPEPAFRINDDMFCVVYDNSERMEERMAWLKRLKDTVTDVPAKASYILIPDSTELAGPDEFFRFLHAHENDDKEITVADPFLIDELRQQGTISGMIDKALLEDRVEVFYQPFYNSKDKKFTAAEALVRIRKEDGSIVPPGEFIPVAEDNGQIIGLGMRVFEKVCKFLASGRAQELGLEYIEINVSAAQFDKENPAKFMIHYMQEYGINPKWINLEITETAANNKHILLTNMNKLIQNGVTFSLDDFGTGRSNLDYFVNMPIKNIKFDHSFTQGYFTNEKTKSVLEGMTKIMQSLNMNVVSEGIESKEQLDAMKALGVEYIQGFYFSKPIPEDQFLTFLEKNNASMLK